MAANLLRPDRRLETTPGRDDAGDRITLYRTEFWLRGEMVDATPWTAHPRQAIRDGDEIEQHPSELPDWIPAYREAQRRFAHVA